MHEMSTIARPIPQKFYRVAYQRFEEAEVPFEAGYYIGAVYLAGYAIEWILKCHSGEDYRSHLSRTVQRRAA